MWPICSEYAVLRVLEGVGRQSRDFHVIRSPKKAVIKGRTFGTGEDVTAVVVHWFQQQPVTGVAYDFNLSAHRNCS